MSYQKPVSVCRCDSLYRQTHSERQMICCEEYRVREVQIAVDVFCGDAIAFSGLNVERRLPILTVV